MKKKFHIVGTLLYVRNFKCGAGVGAAIIAGVASSAAGAAVGAGINAASTAAVNADNEDLTRESWGQQSAWMHEQMFFNHSQAKLAREWQSEENQLSRMFAEEQAQKAYDFNAQQAQIDRDFQAEQAALARDWNAVDAQMARAKAAGVNPALYAGGSMPTSNITPGGAAASGNPASAPSNSASPAASVGTPSALMIPKQSPNLNALSHLGEIGNQVADIKLKDAEAKRIKAEERKTNTYNQFQEYLLKSNIKVNEATSAKLYADVKQAEAYIDEIKAKVQQIQAATTLTNNEAKIKEIEAYFKSDECQAMIDKLKSETNWNDKMIDYYFTKLPLELGVLRSESAVNAANAKLSEIRSHLTAHEINQVDAVTSLYQTENANALIDHTVKRMYDVKNAGEDYKQNKAATKQAEYQSSDAVQIIGTTCQIVNSVTGIATSAAGAGAAVKYIKGGNKPPKVKGF